MLRSPTEHRERVEAQTVLRAGASTTLDLSEVARWKAIQTGSADRSVGWAK